ncbi:MAG TPA: hypothetical protein VGB75_08345 [Jatrophihabitans sp.]|jgi:hypothetical protein|uniref:hypothetical protein n=1 Tax=Jatrophihabitans sp. TaxID=1932789 RepID=UPI002EE48280
MGHLTEGALRRLLDEPAGVSDADRRHVAGCPQCLDALAATRSDATLVGAALAGESAGDLDMAAAWRRLSTALPAAAPERAPAPARPPAQARAGRWRELLRRPVVAALAVAVVFAGAGTAAANDWLQIFRTEQIAPLNLSAADLIALPDLSAYGTLAMTSEPDVHEVADAAAAAAESGLDVPEVTDLPRGVRGEPVYQVGRKMNATFTFSAERAARAADEAGTALPPVPPGLDGSSVRLTAGPGVAQTWKSSAGAPALIVGRAVAPTATSSGVAFEVVRDYLLSLPGLPDRVAEQLRAFTADGSTLPLPVPADEVTTKPSQVNGVPATVLQTRNRALAAVVWVADGAVTAVAGSLDTDEVLSIARGLK